MTEYSPVIDQQIAELLAARGAVTVYQLAGVAEEDAGEMLRQYMAFHPERGPFEFDGRILRPAMIAVPTAAAGAASAAVVSAVGAPAPMPAPMPAPAPAPAVTPAPGPLSPSAAPSPVDVVLAMPPRRALLDSAPSGGRVPKGYLLLPVVFGLLGGLLAWLFLKDENPAAARNLLIAGVVVQVVSTIAALAMVPMLRGMQLPF